jgi:hypothetical protein
LTLFDGAGPRNRRLRAFLRRRARAEATARPGLDRAHRDRLFCRRAVVFTDCADFTVRTLRDGILHFLMCSRRRPRAPRPWCGARAASC